MIELATALSPPARDALADLERRTLAVDGGRLKLEWGVLAARTGDAVEDLLWWDGDRLLGFLGLYGFGAPTVELAGMVDPAARRRGIASALLAGALSLCRAAGYTRALLVVPRAPVGRAFAQARGGRLEHSEHALELVGAPAPAQAGRSLRLRPATTADAGAVAGLLAAAFAEPAPGQPVPVRDRTLLAEVAGAVVGTVRTTRHGDTGAVYGFAVAPAHQGRGIGREVLRRVCGQLLDDGATRVTLEVAVDNERALGLYTSLGFTRVTTEDYYALPLGGA